MGAPLAGCDGPFREPITQLSSRDSDRLIVSGEIELQAVTLDRDAQTGWPNGQIEQLPQLWLGEAIKAAVEPEQHVCPVVGNQRGR
ncbi:MAG: hypothetical protein HYS13_15290 [Planctomycetia bacterium]|nr:hypothetical protein [Planctomycetia bacterium]